MKKCNKCGETKSVDQFNKKGGGRLQSYCRECQRAWYKNYYDNSPKEKERLAISNAALRDEFRDIVRAAKDVPCTDCNERYPYYVMDFDHVSDDKLCNVGEMVGSRGSKKALLDEIAKCEVVCANCHRERTHQRGR